MTDDFKKSYDLARADMRALMQAWDEREAEPLSTLTVAMVLLTSSAYSLFDDTKDADRFLEELRVKGRRLFDEVEGVRNSVH